MGEQRKLGSGRGAGGDFARRESEILKEAEVLLGGASIKDS